MRNQLAPGSCNVVIATKFRGDIFKIWHFLGSAY
jgi:hypothetical protein